MLIQSELLALFPSGGYFVEAGAHDGVGDSQTKSLEDVGWRGLCVEPSSAFVGLAKSRKCSVDNRCLYNTDGATVSFREVEGNAVELSGIDGHFYDTWDREGRPHKFRVVKTVKLHTALADHQAPPLIEFLCLDTEGTELLILKAHDFGRYLFQTILVEHNGVAERRSDLLDFLCPIGYRLLQDDGVNLFVRYYS